MATPTAGVIARLNELDRELAEDLGFDLGDHIAGLREAAADVTLAEDKGLTAGTATLVRSGNNLVATLPTTDPAVAGALWVDGVTVKVSAGE